MAITPLKLNNIQGNILAGFNKDFQSYMFVSFPEGSDPKGWLKQLLPNIATTAEVDAFNTAFKAIVKLREERKAPETEGEITATWVNVAISASGLAALGVPAGESESFPADFREGMRKRAEAFGDVGPSAPEHWQEPLGSTAIHAVVLIAADELKDLQAEIDEQTDLLSDHGLELAFKQEGRVRTDLPGHEHFGFKDGISQPAIHGVSAEGSANQDPAGQPMIWPGEFVLGYQTQEGPPSPPPPPQGPPYGPASGEPPAVTTLEPSPEPGPPSQAGPPWTADGSFLVLRRLRQDVAAFQGFVAATAAGEDISPSLLGAKMLGRYASGCPLEHLAAESAALDPQVADPSLDNQALLEEPNVNGFTYADDAEGAVVPRAAHIRKVNPRNEPSPGGIASSTNEHRIIRRGIPFGAPYDPGAAPGSPLAAQVDFPEDRGLLFVCYQASIEEQFEFLESRWVNNPNFPNPGDGQDPIIAQLAEPRSFRLPGLGQPELSIRQFVTTTGGEYFFSPSISALEQLAGA